MSNMKTPQKSQPPEILKLNTALKMAEQWLNNMTPIGNDEPTVVEPENRPPRLGLGAKVSRQFRSGPSNDPLDRKLYAKLDAGKRQAARKTKEDTLILNNEDDEDDDEEESRTAMFDKKRAATPVAMPPFRSKKKQR
ncbi:uncharacterized protein LOC111024338 [Momordica charantia]|uniref:Uncharacterized protein LOC111024338 n=1 Tax=Momordica charantia TaxID=3673 RepID=A0A6J1DX89_MOMCH|nr:uncharacterized protein LOC111024338 [Momordica charantia]